MTHTPADFITDFTARMDRDIRQRAQQRERAMSEPTEAQIEAAARAMFYMSFGARLDLYHWPGDDPKPVRYGKHFPHLDGETISADHPSAPGNGNAPDDLREAAKVILTAALSVEGD